MVIVAPEDALVENGPILLLLGSNFGFDSDGRTENSLLLSFLRRCETVGGLFICVSEVMRQVHFIGGCQHGAFAGLVRDVHVQFGQLFQRNVVFGED